MFSTLFNLFLLHAQSLQLGPTLCDYELEPARLLYPWDSPGKNTGGAGVPSSKDPPNPGIKPSSPVLQLGSLPLSHHNILSLY